MRNLLTCIFIICISTSVSGQKLKKKTEVQGNLKEVYFIDKETRFTNGNYFKINTITKDTLVFGQFKNASRIGTWVFNQSDKQEKIIEFDFTNDSLIFLARQSFADSFLVKIDNMFIYTKVDRPLIFIGYKDEEKDIIGNQIQIPSSMLASGKIGTSLLKYEVDENGFLTGSIIITSINSEIDQQLNTIINSLNGRFLPAMVNKKPVPSMFYVMLSLLGDTDAQPPINNKLPFIIDIRVFVHSTIKVEKRLGTVKIPVTGSSMPSR